jgi:hypothetical protein
MSWPFERANALGYAMFELFTSADATLIDKNAASAASGDIWSDIALVTNYSPVQEVDTGSTLGQAVIWDPVRRRWWNFGSTGTKPTGFYSRQNGPWTDSGLFAAAVATNWTAANSAAISPAGVIIVGGTANDQKKIRRSADGATWTEPTTGTSASASVNAAVWSPSANLFVIGLSNGATSNVETSPDGIAWTQRTAPNNKARTAIAVSPERIVITSDDPGNDKIITSEDGIVWTERTLPLAAQGEITYNAERGLFMVCASTSFMTSPDGITWTTVTTGGPSPGALASFGRMFMRGRTLLHISVDDGATWQTYGEFDLPFAVADARIASSGNQVMAYRNQNVQRSLFGGQ